MIITWAGEFSGFQRPAQRVKSKIQGGREGAGEWVVQSSHRGTWFKSKHTGRDNAMVMLFTLLRHQLLCSLDVVSLRLVCDAEICLMVPCARMLIEALHRALESRSEEV